MLIRPLTAAVALTLASAAPALLAPAPALAQADTLRVGVTFLPPTRGQPHANSGAHSIFTYDAIYDFLTDANNDGATTPDLAVNWKNMTPTTWQFSLRPNVKFSNGRPLTAESIVGIVNFYLSADGKATMSGGTVNALIAGAKVIDPLTVEIESKAPDPSLPAGVRSMFIYDPKAWEEMGAAKFGLEPVGTGPYKVVAWNPENVSLAHWDGAWTTPRIKKLEVIALPEAASRVQALISKQIDLTPYLPMDAIPQVEAAGVRTEIFRTPNIFSWAFMGIYRDTPFKDKRVRQAANYAINKQGIIDNLLRGATVPASQAATPQTFGYNPAVKPYPHDPAKAKALLAEAGYPNGFDMEAVVIPNIAPADTDIHQQVAQELTQVGIRTSVKPQPFSEWTKSYFAPGAREDFGKGWGEKAYTFQLGITLDTFTDPAPRLANPWSCKRPPHPFWCNEEESALLEKAGNEFDVEKRRKILQDFQVKFNDNAPVLFLLESADIVGRQANIDNAKLVFRVFKYDQISKR